MPWRSIFQSASENRDIGENLGVVFFDLDYFKEVNEKYGHRRGDIILEIVGARLLSVSRHWRFGRYGGDEFVGFRRNVRDMNQLDADCQELVAALTAPITADGEEIHPGVTIGRTLSADPHEAIDQITARAKGDERRRKRERPDPSTTPTDDEFLHSLMEGGLWVAYQPVIEVPTRAVIGFESLLRFSVPGRGDLNPEAVVDGARRLGRLNDLTMKVAEIAIDAMDALAGIVDLRIVCGINIEGEQIHWNNEALEFIANKAQHSRARVILEITERGNHFWDDEQYAVVEDLERRGIDLALDDYGAGQSRLRAVSRHKWRTVKLDRDFITTSEPGLVMLRHNVAALHELGQQVLLEGIEDEETMVIAEELGINYAQGYYLGGPMRIDDLVANLKDFNFLDANRTDGPSFFQDPARISDTRYFGKPRT
jgi:diguanylate cyclase (GGDEF)-like protein